MAEFPALPLWTDAYLGDTTHLDATEHGAYLLLLIVSWRAPDTQLPDDDRLLARYARCTPRVWAKLRPIIAPFFERVDGYWRQNRLREEKKIVERRRDLAAENGRASALKRKDRHSTRRPTERDADLFAGDQREGNAEPTPTPTPTPNPIPTYKEDDADTSSKKRGHRLTEDWQPRQPYPTNVDDLVAQWPRGREARALDEFRDYWTSIASHAAKLDWNKTWHNRIRDQHDRIMRENRNGVALNGHHTEPRSLRGDRPDPALDMLREAIAEERADLRQAPDRRDRPALPSK